MPKAPKMSSKSSQNSFSYHRQHVEQIRTDNNRAGQTELKGQRSENSQALKYLTMALSQRFVIS